MKIKLQNEQEYLLRRHIYFLNDRIHDTHLTMTLDQLFDRIDKLYPAGTTTTTNKTVDWAGLLKAYAKTELKDATPLEIYKYYIEKIVR